MSISSYSELKTAVANWLHRTDLTAKIPDFITLAEGRIYGDLRVRAMEKELSGTIAAGVLAVPSDYLELKHAYVNTSSAAKLSRKSPEWIIEYYPNRTPSGVPSFIARDRDSFIFGPYPDSGYTVKGTYYAKLTALSDSNTSNWLITGNPDLILAASCMEASEYSRDQDGLAYWAGKYDAIRARVQGEDKQEAFSGSILARTAN